MTDQPAAAISPSSSSAAFQDLQELIQVKVDQALRKVATLHRNSESNEAEEAEELEDCMERVGSMLQSMEAEDSKFHVSQPGMPAGTFTA